MNNEKLTSYEVNNDKVSDETVSLKEDDVAPVED